MFNVVSIGLLCNNAFQDLQRKRVKKIHVGMHESALHAVVNNIVQRTIIIVHYYYFL